MIDEDVKLAWKIIQNGCNITKQIYHNSSFIYATTNERIKEYQNYLENKKNVLSVISSGDQILNTALAGSLNIDGYDISRFPKYYMELKRAGVISLNLEQFIDFFFTIDYHENEKYDDLYYDLIRMNLERPYKDFWDNLFNFFDWYDVFHSTLFSSQNFSLDSIINNNSYLHIDEYQKLKEILKKVNFNYYTSDIFTLFERLKKKYDFINLSSVIYYVKNYNELLAKLNLDNNGIALTYLYNVNEEMKKFYSNCQIIAFNNCYEGVMIYKKK